MAYFKDDASKSQRPVVEEAHPELHEHDREEQKRANLLLKKVLTRFSSSAQIP
jgi:hypothetical protein